MPRRIPLEKHLSKGVRNILRHQECQSRNRQIMENKRQATKLKKNNTISKRGRHRSPKTPTENFAHATFTHPTHCDNNARRHVSSQAFSRKRSWKKTHHHRLACSSSTKNRKSGCAQFVEHSIFFHVLQKKKNIDVDTRIHVHNHTKCVVQQQPIKFGSITACKQQQGGRLMIGACLLLYWPSQQQYKCKSKIDRNNDYPEMRLLLQ